MAWLIKGANIIINQELFIPSLHEAPQVYLHYQYLLEQLLPTVGRLANATNHGHELLLEVLQSLQ